MNAVELLNVSKILKRKEILKNIDLSLESGKVYGFFGHNGSGKSMLFRVISGLITPTEGEVTVFGKKIGKDAMFPDSLGIIIETAGFWPHYTGFENLKTLAEIKNIVSDDKIRESISRVGLDPSDKRTFNKFSLGMKQRLGIAQAIMEEPKLLIFDEPTNALDEDGIALFNNIVKQEVKRGATVLIANHNKDELKLLCGRFFKMNDGRLEEADGDSI